MNLCTKGGRKRIRGNKVLVCSLWVLGEEAYPDIAGNIWMWQFAVLSSILEYITPQLAQTDILLGFKLLLS